MDWAEVSVRTTHEAMDLVADVFYDLGAAGVVMDDPLLLNDYIDSGKWDYTDLQRAEVTDVVTVSAYLPLDGELDGQLAALKARLAALAEEVGIGEGVPRWRKVQDEDWAESWKKYWHTERIGQKLVIKPTWEEYTPQPQDVVIELDPGAAFGTGSHHTTLLCLRELETLVAPGDSVFDIGCGSGVLAIAAAKLGAATVTAVDADEIAVGVARENVRQNGVQNTVSVTSSDLWQNVTGKAEVITANIIADVIIRLLPGLDAHLTPKGKLIASGIIADRYEDVKVAVAANGFTVEKTAEAGGWVLLVVAR